MTVGCMKPAPRFSTYALLIYVQQKKTRELKKKTIKNFGSFYVQHHPH